MRTAQIKTLVHLLMTSLFILAPLASIQPATAVRARAADSPQLKSTIRQGITVFGPEVSPAVTPGVSPPVRDLPLAQAWQPGDPVRQMPPRQNQTGRPAGTFSESHLVDPLLQAAEINAGRTPTPMLNFAGIGSTGFVPPDTIGDVGPNHYVQMVNVSFAIFNKSGTLLTGPTSINALWTGQGNQCEANNDGDPVVLYDPLADRWMLAQFAVPNPYYMCIAISQTPDPTGAYFLYEFQVPDFPDYPKFGVWPDAYYMSTNETNAAAYAFDRSAMLSGAAATFQRFTTSGNFMLPSDLDGSTPPPAGAPNYFYTLMDDTFWGGGPDRLEIWEFHVDWTTPANSTFTLGPSLPTTAFIYTVCGFFVLNCIPQPAPGQSVDAVSEWPMWRFAYRNFGSHETLVGNFAIDVDNTNHAGIRWFELRDTGAGWTLYQEGTHAPDAHNRFMGSIAMDGAGDIALGYSVSSSSLMPAIRYATRLASDPLGTLQAEQTLIAGGGVQTGSSRWGDYSAMSVDPVDDCTFWYTNEYYQSTSGFGWSTRIGTFIVPGCALPEADLSLSKTDTPDPVIVGQALTYTLTIENKGPISATNVILTDTLPASVLFGSASATQGSCQDTAGTVVCDVGVMQVMDVVSASIVVTPTVSQVITNTAEVASFNSDPVPDNNLASAATTVRNLADLALVKSDTPDPVTAGDLLTYTLNVSNQGPMAAPNVVVSDNLPPTASTLISAPGCVEVLGALSCSLSSLASGASAAFTVTVQVAPGANGVITNTAVASSDAIDPDPLDDSATITTTIQTLADLALGKSDTPDPVLAGELLTYTLTVQNNGPSNALGVFLTDTLPAALAFVSASPGCTLVGSAVTCSLGAITAGASRIVEITASVDPGASGALNNSAEVSAQTADPNPANNSAAAATSIETPASADLALSKTADPDPVQVSAPLTYTLVITNQGPSVAANVILTDTLPAEVNFHHASPGCTYASGVVLCNVSTLLSGGSAAFEIVVQVGGLPGEELVNMAEVASAVDDPDLSDNSAQVASHIQWQLWLPYLSR